MGRWNAWDVEKFGTQNVDCSSKPEKGEPRAEGDGRGEVGPGDLRTGRSPSSLGGRGVVWLGPQRKTKVKLRTGSALGGHLPAPSPSLLLQVAIKVIPRNRVLGWSTLVSIFFGALSDLMAPWLTMGSLAPRPFYGSCASLGPVTGEEITPPSPCLLPCSDMHTSTQF